MLAKRARAGFTLVELLVVITIISMKMFRVSSGLEPSIWMTTRSSR